MKNKILSSIIIVFALLISANLNAQKPTDFEKATADASKIKARFDFPAEGRTSKNGSGYSANVDLLDPKPKKVALISFYLYDPASGATSTKSNTYATTYSASIWTIDQALAQTHVDGFYAKSLDKLKEGFKEYGIDLLTPEEFLDTEEKEDFFYGFNQETGKKEKTERRVIGSYVSVKGNTLKICPYEEGYRPFFVVNEPVGSSMLANFVNMGIGGANRKMTSSLGYDLPKELGVDAALVCYIVVRKPKNGKEDYVIDAVSLYMLGPNPKADGPDDKNRGQFYCGTRFFAKLINYSSSKTGVTSYDHMGNVMLALSKKMGNWVINREK